MDKKFWNSGKNEHYFLFQIQNVSFLVNRKQENNIFLIEKFCNVFEKI